MDQKPESYAKSFPPREKKFIIKHTFKNVSSLHEGGTNKSETQSHYGVHWGVAMKREAENYMDFVLFCTNDELKNAWTVETTFSLIVHGLAGEKSIRTFDGTFSSENMECAWDTSKFLTRTELLENIYDDEITVSVEVKVLKMTGAVKPAPRSFDENEKQFADVRLIVEDEEFYVLRGFLAIKSAYFREMFFPSSGSHIESEQTEVTLPNVDHKEFQAYLETLHGMFTLNNQNVEGVLFLADMYFSSDALLSCEKFLLFESEKTWTEKFELAVKYHLKTLINKCISEMTTVSEIPAVTIQTMNYETMRAFLNRSIASLDLERGGQNADSPIVIP